MYFTCLFLYIGCLLTIIFYIFQVLFGSLLYTVPFEVGLLLLIYCILNVLIIAINDPFNVNKDTYE